MSISELTSCETETVLQRSKPHRPKFVSSSAHYQVPSITASSDPPNRSPNITSFLFQFLSVTRGFSCIISTHRHSLHKKSWMNSDFKRNFVTCYRVVRHSTAWIVSPMVHSKWFFLFFISISSLYTYRCVLKRFFFSLSWPRALEKTEKKW